MLTVSKIGMARNHSVAEGLITPDILAREDEIEAEAELAEVMEASEAL